MKFYKLTRDELYNLPISTTKYDDLEIAMRASQKKLLGDIESHVIYHNKAPFIPSKYWQSLLKDFGIS